MYQIVLTALLLTLSSAQGKPTAKAYYQKYEKAKKAQKLTRALKFARLAEKADTKNGLYPYCVGELLVSLKKPAAALRAFKRSDAKGYNQPWLVLYEAVAYRDLEQFEKSLHIMQEGAKKFPEYEYLRGNQLLTYYLAMQHHVRKQQRAKVQLWTTLAIDAVDPAQSYEANTSVTAALRVGLQYLKDQKQFDEAYASLTRHFGNEPQFYEDMGWCLFHLHEGASKPMSREVDSRVKKIRREGMSLFEEKNPNRLRVDNLRLPLKGLFYVGNRFDGKAWSHVGLQGKYCYDFGNVDVSHSPYKVGSKGKRNGEWIAFDKPILAVRDGVVEKANDNFVDQRPGISRSGGNSIIIRHKDGSRSSYAHLKYNSLQVKVGQRVKGGQLIARVGNTGPSGGPHLHFCIWDKDTVTIFHTFRKATVHKSKGQIEKGFIGRYEIGWIIQGESAGF